MTMTYTIRKAEERDVYDAWWDIRGRTERRLPAVPKPKGWVVEHSAFRFPQPVPTKKAAEELVEHHAHGFWPSRCELFAEVIDFDSGEMGLAAIRAFVLDSVNSLGLTMADFIELDERPGQFWVNGRDYGASYWHRNLRVTRNDPNTDLFARLRANSLRPVVKSATLVS